MNLYKVTLGLTTGATYNVTNVHVFKEAQARRAYFYLFHFLLQKEFRENKVEFKRKVARCVRRSQEEL